MVLRSSARDDITTLGILTFTLLPANTMMQKEDMLAARRNHPVQSFSSESSEPRSKHGTKVAILAPNDHSAPHEFFTSNIGKSLIASEQQLKASNAQLERYRQVLKDRDMELHSIRSENALLKQMERRFQKDAEQIEVQYSEGPRIIKGLRDEVTHLKVYCTNTDENQDVL